MTKGPRRRAAIVAIALVCAVGIAWRVRVRRASNEVASSASTSVVTGSGNAGDASARDDVEPPIFAGCAAVLRDGACELKGDGHLRVFVLGDPDRVRFVADGARVEPSRVDRVADGAAFELTVGANAASLVVESESAPSLTLRLKPPLAPWPELDRARVLRGEGKLDEAGAVARAARVAATDDVGRARAASLLARIALSGGDEKAIDPLFAESIVLEESVGRTSSAAEDSFAFVFSLIGRRRLAEARRVLVHARELSRDYPEGQTRVLYYDAWIASATARWRDALRGFRRTEILATRLAMRVERLGARELATPPLIALGRSAEAVDDLVALYDSDAATSGPCEVADLAANVGIIAMEDSKRGKVDARAWLDRARVLYRDTCPSHYDPLRVANLLGDLARAEMMRGDRRAARERLAEAERAAPHPREALALEWLRTKGDLALGDGDLTGALAAYDALATRAKAVEDVEAERRGLEGRAEVLARRGDREGAVAALARAADRIDAQSIDVPIGEGREGFVRDRENADARRVELLFELGRHAEALAHLRRARARVLASISREGRLDALAPDARERWEDAIGAYQREREAIDRDARDDWKLATSTLATRVADRARRSTAARAALEQAIADLRVASPRAPATPAPMAAGELVLAYHATAHGWLGFAADANGVRGVRLAVVDPSASPESLASIVLAPFAIEIGRAKRVAVLAFGDARRIDVHALPWEGAPLVARVPVVYPIAGDVAFGDDGALGGRALVVGDPTRDLAGARAEVDAVESALTDAARWQTTTLLGRAAGGAEVRASLASSDLFHYAGHAAFAGRDGWESALRLADHAELGIPDVLALAHAPRLVVLLGCETARTSGASSGEGLGLAHAFLLAGSHAVIASSRVVDDAATADLARALYAAIVRGEDPPSALRSAQRALAARNAVDWSAFRVLVP